MRLPPDPMQQAGIARNARLLSDRHAIPVNFESMLMLSYPQPSGMPLIEFRGVAGAGSGNEYFGFGNKRQSLDVPEMFRCRV